jgi:hypothetical protein
VSDAKKAIAGFDNFAGKLDKLDRGASKLAGWGATATAAWGALAGASISAASEMQQSTGAVEAVFKDQAAAIKGFASDAADNVGLSAAQYQNMAALIGSQLKNLGVEYDALVPKTDELIGLGADLAATYGGTAADAVEALSSALKGEYDPLEKYGISLNKSAVNARLASKGMEGLEGEALKLAETEAMLEIITEQSGDALGMFASEADTAAGQAERATAKWEDAKAALGEGLLPIVTQITEKMGEFAEEVGKNPDLFIKLGAALAGFTAAMFGVVGAVKLYQATVVVFGAVSAIWSAIHNSMLATAVRTWIAQTASAAASALATAAAWIGARVTLAAIWISMQVQAAASAIAAGAAWAVSAAGAAIGWIGARVTLAAIWISMQVQAAASAIAAGAAWAVSAAQAAIAWVAPRIAMMLATGATYAMAAAQWILNAALTANPIGIVIALLVALAAGLVIAYQKSDTFRSAVQRAGDVAKSAFSGVAGVINGIIGAISNLIGWIGRIKWPSPPSWFSSMSSAGSPDLMGVPGVESMLKFMAPPSLAMSAPAPDLTAARVPPPSLAALTGSGSGTVTIDNSIEIKVDGSGVVDARAVAEAIRKAITTDGRRRGLITAAGTSNRGGALWP